MTPLSISESSLTSNNVEPLGIFNKGSKSFEEVKSQQQTYQNTVPKSSKTIEREKEDSLNYTNSVNESVNGAWITGNFGGTFSNFKLDSKRGFNGFKASSSIDKLIKKYDIDIQTLVPETVRSAVKDLMINKPNSSIFQNRIIVFEEEKHKISDSINKIFRKYEKIYNKAFKKLSQNEFFVMK